MGDLVTLPFPGDGIPAVVVEDRGPLGPGGSRVVAVHTLESQPESRGTFDILADWLEPPRKGATWGDRVRVGQRVSLPYPWGRIPAEVIEDRGQIGHQGRRIVVVRTLEDVVEARSTFEYPAEELAPPESDRFFGNEI